MADNEKLIEEALRPMTNLDVTQNPPQTRAFIRQLGEALEAAEKADTPTDDERELAQRLVARQLPKRIDPRTAEFVVRSLEEAGMLRRTDVPEPSAEGYAAFEDWEQEMFRHQPVLSMADESIAGCQCLDRVFVKDREDWGTHLAAVITARLTEQQGEPSDAQVLEDFLGKLAGDGAYTLDFSSAASLHDHIVRLLKRDIASLRAAGGVR